MFLLPGIAPYSYNRRCSLARQSSEVTSPYFAQEQPGIEGREMMHASRTAKHTRGASRRAARQRHHHADMSFRHLDRVWQLQDPSEFRTEVPHSVIVGIKRAGGCERKGGRALYRLEHPVAHLSRRILRNKLSITGSVGARSSWFSPDLSTRLVQSLDSAKSTIEPLMPRRHAPRVS